MTNALGYAPIGGLLLLTLVLSHSEASKIRSGKFNPVLEIGQVAPSWEALQATDGKAYSSQDLSGAEVTVIVFTCNTCPYAIDYEERLQQLHSKYEVANEAGTDTAGDNAEQESAEQENGPLPRSRVRVIAINPNAIPDDSIEKMQARAEEREFGFVYLKDPEAKLADAFGAVRTPEWFVLNQNREVVYMGAFDDSSEAQKVNEHYLEDAVEAELKGDAVPLAETAPVGCLVRRPRRR